MDEQQIREVAEAAFHRHFGAIEVFGANVRPGYGFEDDSPVVDVAIICDGKHEQLNGAGLLHVESEITSKVWYEREDSPGWPLVHFLPESSLGRRDPTMV